MGLNFGGQQLLTEHGDFGRYLHCFDKRENDTCECGITEDRKHVFFECRLTARVSVRKSMIDKYGRRILNGLELRKNGKIVDQDVSILNK